MDPPIKDTDHLAGFYQNESDNKNIGNIWDDPGNPFVAKNGDDMQFAQAPSTGTLNQMILHVVHQNSKDFKRVFLWAHKL